MKRFQQTLNSHILKTLRKSFIVADDNESHDFQCRTFEMSVLCVVVLAWPHVVSA